ncbi:MAG: flagellar hook-basal body complex protein [Actinobacteria bacterium]|nr:flagellar hook-basal body complex protein [Actinomycetota bacterium]
MLPALRSAASGLLAHQLMMDVTADNLANVNTPGFKRALPRFTDLVGPAGGGGLEPLDRIGLGARPGEVSVDFRQGMVEQTENPLHLCVEGEGFFAVRLEDGTLGFLRAGVLGVDGGGRLTLNGHFLLEPPIRMPAGARQPVVDEKGVVMVRMDGQGEEEVGRIFLARFPNPQGLERRGDCLLVPTTASGDPVVNLPGEEGLGLLRQGFLERSNVEMAEEMVRMITALRAYQLNSRMLQASDEALDAANKIVRG